MTKKKPAPKKTKISRPSAPSPELFSLTGDGEPG